MQTILLNTGKAALARAVAEGTKLKVTAYRIGQAANFAPSITATNVAPVSVYQGDSATIDSSLLNEDEIRYVITVLEPVGPFNIGNIMLFLKDSQTGNLIPYLYGVLPLAVPKSRNNPPLTIGNRIVLNLTAKYTNVSEAFDLSIVTPNFASLPNLRDENDLPNPNGTSYQQIVLLNNTATGSPALVVRREIDNSWFIDPHFMRIDDPQYGAMTGGIAGDAYLPYYGTYYSGGYYKTPAPGFDKIIDGGANWSVPTLADNPVDAGAY